MAPAVPRTTMSQREGGAAHRRTFKGLTPWCAQTDAGGRRAPIHRPLPRQRWVRAGPPIEVRSERRPTDQLPAPGGPATPGPGEALAGPTRGRGRTRRVQICQPSIGSTLQRVCRPINRVHFCEAALFWHPARARTRSSVEWRRLAQAGSRGKNRSN